MNRGFTDSSVGKESACNAGDPGLIPGSGRSPGVGKGYPLQHSGLENSMDRGALAGYSPSSYKETDVTEQPSLLTFISFFFIFTLFYFIILYWFCHTLT